MSLDGVEEEEVFGWAEPEASSLGGCEDGVSRGDGVNG